MVISISSALSNKLTNASFLAACLVVGIHSANGPIKAPFVCRIAVPFFFIVSGFLLAGGCEKTSWYREAVVKRIKTLLIPYVLVCGMWFPIQYCLHEIAVRYAGATPDTMVLSWRTPFDVFGLFFYGGPLAVGMWYIRCLFLLVLLSPLILPRIIKSISFAVCMVVLLSAIAVSYSVAANNGLELNPWWCYFFNFGIPPYAVACFAIGCALRAWRFELKFPKAVGVVSLLLSLLSHYCVGQGFSFVTNLLMILGFWQFIPSVEWPKLLVKNSFPLFILHPIFIYLMTYFLRGFQLANWLSTCTGYVLSYIAIIVFTCWIAQKLRIYMPCFSAKLFGGR